MSWTTDLAALGSARDSLVAAELFAAKLTKGGRRG